MKKFIKIIDSILKGLDFLSPIVDFAVRFYVAMIFWKSGLVKYSSIDSTIWLFTNEYKVPILSPVFAAYLSTAAELIFSGLLIIGILGRFSALVLFIVNLVAMFSYPNLHDEGVQWHLVWGLLLLIPIFHGTGKISIDYWLWNIIKKRVSS